MRGGSDGSSSGTKNSRASRCSSCSTSSGASTASLSGTTRESVAFLDFAKARGAKVVTLVGHADTPLGRGADHALANYAADDTSSENFYVQSLLIALSVMQHRGELGALGDYTGLIKDLQVLPHSLLAVKKAVEPKAAEPAAPPATPEDVALLRDIRDLLAKQKAG